MNNQVTLLFIKTFYDLLNARLIFCNTLLDKSDSVRYVQSDELALAFRLFLLDASIEPPAHGEPNAFIEDVTETVLAEGTTHHELMPSCFYF